VSGDALSCDCAARLNVEQTPREMIASAIASVSSAPMDMAGGVNPIPSTHHAPATLAL
jgi:hypothetical protein